MSVWGIMIVSVDSTGGTYGALCFEKGMRLQNNSRCITSIVSCRPLTLIRASSDLFTLGTGSSRFGAPRRLPLPLATPGTGLGGDGDGDLLLQGDELVDGEA